MNTKEKGELTEARVLAKLSEYDVEIFTPFGENTRSDLLVLTENEIERIQIKTGRLKDGSVKFSCSKVNPNRSGSTRTNYNGQIDAFIVHCPGTDGYYYIPIEKANNTNMWLRIDESMGDNGKVKWAKDFTLNGTYPEFD